MGVSWLKWEECGLWRERGGDLNDLWKLLPLLQLPLRLYPPRLAVSRLWQVVCRIPDIATFGSSSINYLRLVSSCPFTGGQSSSQNLPKKKLSFSYYLPFFHKSWFHNAFLKIHLEGNSKPSSCTSPFLLHKVSTPLSHD